MLSMNLAHIRIVDIGQGGYFEHAILDADTLLLVRESDNLAVVAIGNEGDAARAGSVLVEKARQDVHGNVGRCATQEVDTMEYWNPQRENGETGVGIYRWFGYRERPC